MKAAPRAQRERQRNAERGESGREHWLRTNERRFHRNDGFPSRSILRLLETRRRLSMPECTPAKAVSLWRDDDGSALVEATIVMPLLISLFLGVFEFSWFFYNQQLVVSGSARRSALHDPNRTHGRQSRSLRPKGSVRRPLHGRRSQHCDHRSALTGGSARVSGWSAADVTISCLSSAALENGDYADGSASMTIIDVATRFADPSLGLFSSLGLKPPMLSFSHQERFIGPG